MINSTKKTVLLAGGLFLSVLSANADDIQDKLNYFRSPEAAAFMKYGEESVNEYTGTANISVPLYTVKCKDIEIPLVLNYNASGIKVDQEASWVGLGWDLTVGGCINYVSAGSKDMIHAAQIPDDSWTQYLTTINKTPWYTDETHKKSIWMSTVPYEYSFVGPYREDVNDGWGVKQYLDSGYGERDFYSVNVLGKSFMFFVDPHTLNVYKIGQAGDEYKVELEYTLGNVRPGLGRQSDISEWKITDSNGFVYIFKERDIIKEPYNSQTEYTSCWYLSEIKSPLIENVTFSYEKRPRQSRPQRIESLCIPIITEQTVDQNDKTYKINESDFPSGFNNTPYFISAPVTNSYVKTIKTQNQTVIFDTSECQENSGRRLNSIVVLSCNNDTVKNYVFSYGEFGYSGIGGNEGISDKSKTDLRLKLDNVKEIASGETHTTSFSYYSTDLPSRMSCARDYWGYYNGKQNKRVKAGRYTLIPAPHEFMSRNYNTELSKRYVDVEYADRFSRGDSMQVGMLNRIDYPTGGYTTYEYEPNRILTTDFTLTDKYRDKKYDEYYNMSFSWDKDHGANNDIHHTVTFELKEETTFDVYVRTQGSLIKGTDMKIMLIKWGSSESYIPITCTCSGNFDLINKKGLKVLSAGKYTLRIIPPDAKGPSNGSIGWGITCQLKGWHKSTLSQSNYTLTCGGLRIRKICNFDNDNSLIDSIAYNYNDSKGSTGVLLNKIETIDVHKYKLFKTTQSPNPSENTQRNDYAKADVYSITPGKSRMSEFYASYNPGIVGYSQVTKRKYNSEGKIERYIVTNYRNTAPKNNVIDYYKYEDCYNGRVLCQVILDADSNLILRTKNTYNIKLVNHYAVNMWHDHETISGNSVSASYTGENIPKTTIWRYPYILSRVELAKATTTEFCPNGKTIVRMKDYSYNPKNHQVSQIDENTSLSNLIQRTKITYTADDSKYKSMANNYHRLNDVVETKKILVENGKENCVSTQRTDYNGGLYLPISASTSVGNAPLEIRAKYTYDNGCNVRSVMIDGKETIYIWSYNSQYPIAKIEGLTFADIRNAIGQIENSQYPKDMPITDRGLRALDEMRRETDIKKINAFISTIREKVNELGGYITTYTYKPLVGITSETLPNGMKTTYEYDGFGRLTQVLDQSGSVISTNSYNYKK